MTKTPDTPGTTSAKDENGFKYEQELVSLVNNLPQTMLYQIMVFPDGRRRFTFVSDNVLQMHEISVEKALADPRSMYSQVSEEDRDRLLAIESESLKNLTPFQCETKFTLPSGRIQWSRLTSQPHRRPDGNVVWDGIEIDITAVRQMMTMNRLFMLVTNSSSDLMAAVDTNCKYIVANNAYLAGHQRTLEEVVGKHYREIVGEETYSALLPHVDRCLQGETVYFRAPITYPAGVRFMENSFYPLRSDSGSIIGIVGVGRDITERKRIEDERREMEHLLRHSQKMEAVGQLAGGVAHDLNNLLTPIMGFSEFLNDRLEQGSKSQKFSQHILNASIKARDLVRKLLAFSRKQTLEFKSVDLNALIREFEPLIKGTIRENVRIHISTDAPAEKVLADKGQLEQVLMNLVVNAQDAMPSSGDLTISTHLVTIDSSSPVAEQIKANGKYIEIEVRDTGHGMTEEVRTRIFDPFFTTKGARGTGLGLATVWGIIRQHDGGILVESIPEQGTSFKLYLPLLNAHPYEAISTTAPFPAPTTCGTETILLVEDEAYVRDVVGEQLESAGYSVLAAESPGEAITILNANISRIDLLISDVIMPEMSGTELYEKALGRKANLKALFISGYPDNIISTSGVLKSGINFIPKPFSRDGLLQKVRTVLDNANK